MSNRLINETSPYLLQHAHNPVDWFPWGEEALQKAKDENKPILVSIGYAACHWCHVMEKESFESEETAALMNEHFINIKIDREERPDLDHIYMDAVQAMTGGGGWPLNVFLTPDGKPFYGGTYFPPQRAFNRPSWQEILVAISSAFREKRNEIDSQAENLTAHLIQSNSFGLQSATGNIFSREKLDEAFNNLMKTADKQWGGFGKAPKFPQTFTIQFLLRYHFITGNKEALAQALLSLDKMIEGGIYDQAGGGFARYSTDEKWLVPHFEKMLYDNALLISVLAEAFQLTKEHRYKKVIEETIEFIKRELMHGDAGFYSALDADSEGEEGKFYVWSYPEVSELLGENAAIFCGYFNISENGNWEGKNILHITRKKEDFLREKNITEQKFEEIIAEGKTALLNARNKRIRPGLDDKIILSWNALMNVALSKAYAATGKDEYKDMAVANMNFLFQNFFVDGKLYHTWKNGKARHPAFLDDHAFLIQALIHLQEITADECWLFKAKDLVEAVLNDFPEDETPYFFYTGKDQSDVIIRKKEVYDGAIPSGNSVMAYNLYHLSILFDRSEWRKKSEEAVASLGQVIIKYPTSFGTWACLLQEMIDGTQEIALIGENFMALVPAFLQQYIPHRVFMAAARSGALPLTRDKSAEKHSLIYLCHNYTCRQPVSGIEELMQLITSQKIQ